MDGWITIGTEIDTKSFDAQIKKLEDELDTLNQEFEVASKYDMPEEEMLKYAEQIEKTNNKLIELRKRQDAINKPDFSAVSSQLDNIGSSINKVIKKVTKWGLALFGIRAMYGFIRNSINTIAGDDEQLQADIDYMKSALAYTLEPLVRSIVGWIKQLMFYIGYIIKQWTGKNIFENANKSLEKSNKKAKQLQKTLAGFDEMNVIGDNSDKDSGPAPSFDLTNLESMEVPAWLDTIVRVGQWVLDNWEDVVGLLLLTKLFFDLITGNWAGVIMDVILFLVTQIPRLWDAIKVVWDSLIEFGKWLWDGIVYIATHFEDIIGGIGNFIGNIVQVIINLINGAIQGIISGFQYAGGVIRNVFNGIVNFFKGIINTIIGLFKNIGTSVGNVIASAFKAVVNGVLKAIESILNTPIKAINGLIKTINKVPGINLSKLDTFKLPRLAKGGIVNMPGKGVPVGGALTGEVSREGVIPLTDSQQMSLLGESIGKYITINLTNVTELDGRQIARKVDKIQQNNNFVFNR